MRAWLKHLACRLLRGHVWAPFHGQPMREGDLYMFPIYFQCVKCGCCK